jgi:PAS domain S-box-containing protein
VTRGGLLVFVVVGLLALVELVFGERAWADIVVVSALGAVSTAIFVLLHRVSGSREELRIRLGQQQAVARLGQLALAEVPRQELLDEASRAVAAELRSDLAAVLELLPGEDALVLAAGVGWPMEQLGVQRVPAGPLSQAGYTLNSSQAVIMRDAATERRFEISGHMAAQGITSGLSARIGTSDATYGVLGAHTYAQRDFSTNDTTFLEAVANVLASALHRLAAEEEIETTHGVLEAVNEDLARNEERFRLAQEGARMGTWDVDLVTGVKTWSEGLRMLYGVGPDHPAGLEHFLLLVHPDDRDQVAQRAQNAYARGADVEYECRIVRPDGNVRWLLTRSTARRDGNGVLVRVLGVALDITRRKLADEDLVRSEELLRLAQAAGRLGAWDWDVETGALHWTPDLYEIRGLDPLSFTPTAENFNDHVHPDDRSALAAANRRVFFSDDSTYESVCRVTRPSGEIRWLVNRGTVFRSPDGTPTRVIGITLDDTARMSAEAEHAQLERRLRQAEKLEAVGQLAGGVAHDFNNLLVAIRGYGELALDRLARGQEGAPEYVHGVLTAADRAAVLTRQLLAFGRRQVLNPEVLDLNDVVRETNGFLNRVIGDNVELVTTLAETPVVVRADRGQLEQVITNLAVNGRDAMSGGGLLTIRVATASLEQGDGARTYALLSVTDEGSGIDAALASHIFEPFFSTKGEEGTGLGLATVHGIVAQSGGQVVLETEVGRGSTFGVYLPLCADELAGAGAAPMAPSEEGTETILLVEDDPAVRSIVSTMLSGRGYEIVEAADGETAILRFETRERSIQLVISDLTMQGIDGRETVERIRATEPATKALYMSGYSDDAIIRSGGLGPGTRFIQKPFSGDELAAHVRELLDAPDPAEPEDALALSR